MQKHEEGGLQKRGFLGVANAWTARGEYAENTYTWSWMPAYHSPSCPLYVQVAHSKSGADVWSLDMLLLRSGQT